MKPNLFIVGAAKCGTTAWVEYLRSHPDIYFPRKKEPNYFCTDFPNWRSVTSEKEYLDLFEGAGDAGFLAEASVHYLFSDEAASNIKSFNPAARILIFVRDHDEFLPSWHNQMLLRLQDSITDFRTAWEVSGRRPRSSLPPSCKEPKFADYKAIGTLGAQVERYFAEFPADRIRVFHLRDWAADPRTAYLEILSFLGLDDDGKTDFPKVNEAKHDRVKWMARLLIDPPQPLRALSRTLRRVLGSRSEGLFKSIVRLNRRKGYREEIDADLRREIRAYYAADSALLESRIWNPGE